MEEIMTQALGNGIWATLFCFLFFLYAKRRKRERKQIYGNAYVVDRFAQMCGGSKSDM